MIGVQQPDGQIVMVLANGNSPIKTSQPRLINLSESNLVQVQESCQNIQYLKIIKIFSSDDLMLKENVLRNRKKINLEFDYSISTSSFLFNLCSENAF